jgi:prolyl-tRNA synthetase
MDINKNEKFSEWYSQVLFEAEIVDIRYPIKGMPVYLPYGFKIITNMFDNLEDKLEKTEHQKVLFPVAIPESIFSKESEHIKGFEGEVLWITKGGKSELDEKLIMRPTSETAMYPMFSLWIRTHADFPLKIHQTTTIYRHETKATRPLLRGREIFWNEAHTANATFEGAAESVNEGAGVYAAFFDDMCMPYFIHKRPDHDKFAGAAYTYAFDAIMPDHKCLQSGTVHNLGENFSKAYDVKYSDENGESKYANLASYGISMRATAGLIGIHGDNKGLILPFKVAPVQIIVIPIYSKENKELIDENVDGIVDLLKEKYTIKIDKGNKRPGEKFYYWELKGVPLRIELGARDIDAGNVSIVTRLGDKFTIKKEEMEKEIPKIIEEYTNKLKERAIKIRDEKVFDYNSMDELKKHAENNERGIVKVGWCGLMECAEKIEEHLDILGERVYYEEGKVKEKRVKRKCIACEKEGYEVSLGKPY